MTVSEGIKVLVNVERSVPGGGSWFWRICSRSVYGSIGLAFKGFLKLQKEVKVEGLDEFLKILESNRDRGVLTGNLSQNWTRTNVV